MAYSSFASSQPEGTSEGPLSSHQENLLATERRWEKILDDPSLRRLLREGHHTDGAHADLLAQVEEDA